MVSLLHAASLPVRFFSLSARQQINLSPKFLLLVGAVDFGSLDRLGLVEVPHPTRSVRGDVPLREVDLYDGVLAEPIAAPTESATCASSNQLWRLCSRVSSAHLSSAKSDRKSNGIAKSKDLTPNFAPISPAETKCLKDASPFLKGRMPPGTTPAESALGA